MRQGLATAAAVVQGLLTSVFALVSLGVAGFDVAAPPAAVDFSPSGLRHTSPAGYQPVVEVLSCGMVSIAS